MLQEIVDWIFLKAGLDSSNQLVNALNYFVYDSIKIILLLFVMIFVIAVLRTYIPQSTIKKYIADRKSGNFFASLFGAVTPFCSCSSIPIFLSFLEAGIPLGIAFSFLITSPIVNEYLFVLMLGLFGWKIAFAYVTSGIIIGTVAGIILGKINLKRFLVKDIVSALKIKEKKYSSFKQRIDFGLDEAKSIVKKLWIWILVGVAIGTGIHNLVPEAFVHSLIDKGGWFSVPLAVILGVPIYGNCAAIVPIAVALFQKGVPLGTALAFMMAISALSLPEAVILRRAMKLKLILIFFSIVAFSIIITGYLFNALQPLLIH